MNKQNKMNVLKLNYTILKCIKNNTDKSWDIIREAPMQLVRQMQINVVQLDLKCVKIQQGKIQWQLILSRTQVMY